MPPRHCSNCGDTLQPGDLFCQRCGRPADTQPPSEGQTQDPRPRAVEEGSVIRPRRKMKSGMMVIVGSGLLLIAAAVGYSALHSEVPTLAAQTTATPAAGTRELAAMVPGPATLWARLVYVRTSTSTLSSATAIPKDPTDAFLVIVLDIPSNSNLYPEDLDWTFRDHTNREFRSVGFGIPLKYDTEQNTPVVFSLLGRLVDGPAVVTSKSSRAVIGVIFVVPKAVIGGTISNQLNSTYTFSILTTGLSLDNAQISTVQFDSSFIEQPDGSESWTVTP